MPSYAPFSMPAFLIPQLWLALSVLLGIGGVAGALYLGEARPPRCSAPYVGCLVEMFMIAASGWMSGLYPAIKSLGNVGLLRVCAWMLLLWNALGSALVVVVIAFLVFT
jgi:hypothetical protein